MELGDGTGVSRNSPRSAHEHDSIDKPRQLRIAIESPFQQRARPEDDDNDFTRRIANEFDDDLVAGRRLMQADRGQFDIAKAIGAMQASTVNFVNSSGFAYNPNNGALAPNPNSFVFWDGFHPTAAVHYLAGWFIFQSAFPGTSSVPKAK